MNFKTRKQSVINKFIFADNDDQKIKALKEAINLNLKKIINDDGYFDRFRIIWNEKTLGVKYVDDIINIKNKIRYQNNRNINMQYSFSGKGVNHFGN
jgi:hypothetical protein